MRCSVSSPDETQRRELKRRRVTEYLMTNYTWNGSIPVTRIVKYYVEHNEGWHVIRFEVIYQTFDTVFHHHMKHLEVRQKYSATRRIFNSLLGVSSGDETLRLMFDILLQIWWHVNLHCVPHNISQFSLLVCCRFMYWKVRENVEALLSLFSKLKLFVYGIELWTQKQHAWFISCLIYVGLNFPL